MASTLKLKIKTNLFFLFILICFHIHKHKHSKVRNLASNNDVVSRDIDHMGRSKSTRHKVRAIACLSHALGEQSHMQVGLACSTTQLHILCGKLNRCTSNRITSIRVNTDVDLLEGDRNLEPLRVVEAVVQLLVSQGDMTVNLALRHKLPNLIRNLEVDACSVTLGGTAVLDLVKPKVCIPCCRNRRIVHAVPILLNLLQVLQVKTTCSKCGTGSAATEHVNAPEDHIEARVLGKLDIQV